MCAGGENAETRDAGVLCGLEPDTARGAAEVGDVGGVDEELDVDDIDCVRVEERVLEGVAACVLRAAVAEAGPGDVVGEALSAEWARKAARKL